MIDGRRIDKLLQERKMSQADLARAVGVSQQTIWKLITGQSSGSRYLHQIARALGTTPDYLTRETDSPLMTASQSDPAAIHFVDMKVALPSEAALTEMFRSLLALVPEEATRDVAAQILAQRLPAGFAAIGPVVLDLDSDRDADTLSGDLAAVADPREPSPKSHS